MLHQGNSHQNINAVLNVSCRFCFEGLEYSTLYGAQGSSSAVELRQIFECGKYSSIP